MLLPPPPELPILPGNLDARFPVVLLPVSVQVKFVRTPGVNQQPAQHELRVRIYPDQLGVSTHEEEITPAENEAGQRYWRATTAGQHSIDAWRAVVALFGVTRSQWIVQQTTPTNLAAWRSDATLDPLFPTPQLAPNDEPWTRPARARGLPDYFLVLLYSQVEEAADIAPGPVLEQLFTGPGRAYDAATVPRPTTEFLRLTKVVRCADLPAGDLPVTFDPSDSPLDPLAPPDPNAIGGVDAGNAWTVDFPQAVAKGLGVVIPLATSAEYEQGFRRLVVLGVRGAGASAGQQDLKDLLTEHYYTDGLQLVPQGTPTNNTEVVASGYSSEERTDAEASFALLTQAATFDSQLAWAQRPDGQHLATALGLANPLPALAHAQGSDISEAQLMNRALWPATYGYFLEEMLRPLLSPAALDWTRAFFERYVLARGPVPALRIGSQPYGVLPTTRFSAWEERGPVGPDRAFAEQLQQVLAQLDATWTERLNPQAGLYPPALGSGATAAGFEAPDPDPGNLLTALGLDATSTEYYQRYLIGPALAEALNAAAQDQDSPEDIWPDSERAASRVDPLNNPLYQEFKRFLDPNGGLNLPAASPSVFSQTFQSTFTKLADAFADEPAARRQEGVLLDEQPLSEKPLAAFQGVKPQYAGQNYLNWLATASFDEIRLENFTRIVEDSALFVAPNSLLYSLMRQAILLEYWSAARAYLLEPGRQPVPADALPEKELFNILATDDKPRWAWLYDVEAGAALHERVRPAMQAYLDAIEKLAVLSTAQLERLLAEHLDLGSYRLDAWRLAPVTERLIELRQQAATAQGSHLGAFGWLEDLRPSDRSEADSNNVYSDPDNLGYVHAPSLTHGTAAAILRQGFKSRQLTADPADPAFDRMAVDLSSRRVRAALSLLDGLRAGHSLGALLGQAFERALTRPVSEGDSATYGGYVASFRKAFPLAAEYAPVQGQTAAQGTAPEQVARQVTDGAALLRAVGRGYPYGVVGLPAAGSVFAEFVAAQVALLADELDALGDVAVTEGIYQAARGNVDRAAGVLEGVAKGQFPSSPEVVHPPQRGLTFTQRVLVHLPVAPSAAGWPNAATPRALAAPRLNAWLAQFFPDPTTLNLTLGYQGADGAWQTAHEVSLAASGWGPLDLLWLLDEGALQAGSAFDQLLQTVFAAVAAADVPAAGARLAVDYTRPGAVALRRRLPLLSRVRQLLGGARPAGPHDLQAPGRLSGSDEFEGVDLPGLEARVAASRLSLADIADELDPAATAPTAGRQRELLYQAALFGVAEAVAALAVPAAAPAATYQAIQGRLAAAAAATASVPGLVEQAAALFGAGFRPDVEFSLSGGALTAYQAATAPAATAQLLAHNPHPLALQEWLHGLGAVREPLNHLDKVFLIQDVLQPDGLPTLPLRPAQLAAQPTLGGDYWLGLPWPGTYAPPAGALSLVEWLPTDYNPLGPQATLWLDEWVETLPEDTQTTALTFHYDQPNAEAPQSLLLVVSPRADTTAAWTTADLLGAVNETLDLAKKRTVEPDALAFTHLATVLPAVVAPVAQQAVTFTLDFGRLNNSARFGEESLAV
ncbi:MAG TPA: hypothetical protein VF629_15880 [Hymenobacter sp.]|jgi:hypothetical protein|uniref:hypothetical protein n=1 Tax=Hymenobacter sp. TaxID=1898978 RepID=UPI002ED9431D